MSVTVSSSHVVSAALCPSWRRLLILLPCSSMRSLSQETVLHKLFQRESFLQAAALHQLPQGGSLPLAAVLQEQAAPVWVPHRLTSSASKPAPAWAPLSMGPQVLAGACSSTGLPTGSQLPSGIHLLQCGVPSMGYRWISALPWTSTDCRGTTCLTMIFIMSCKGRLSALTFWATPAPPPSSLTLVPAELFLSQSHSSLHTAVLLQSFFFPFFNMLSQRH